MATITQKLGVKNWLNEEELDNAELFTNYIDSNATAKKILLNIGQLASYKGYSQNELGEEIATSLGMIEEDNPLKNYIDFEKIAQERIEDEEYVETADGYLWTNIPDQVEDAGVFLGKMNTDDSEEFVQLQKHSWNCEWYYGFGYLQNSGSHTHLDSTILDENLGDAFTHTWMNEEIWDSIRTAFKDCYSLKEIADEAHSFKPNIWERANGELNEKLDLIWKYLKNKTSEFEFDINSTSSENQITLEDDVQEFIEAYNSLSSFTSADFKNVNLGKEEKLSETKSIDNQISEENNTAHNIQ